MNTENFYKVLKLLGILFLFGIMYGLISTELMPIYQMVESFKRFNAEGLVTGNVFLFLSIALFILILLEPKKLLTFLTISFSINLTIIKILSGDWECFYALNLSSISVISAFIVEYFKNKEKRETYNYGLFLIFTSLSFGYLVITTLSFMKYILPNAYDTKAVFIDSFYHITKDKTNIFYIFLQNINENDYVYQFFFYVYNLLSPAIFLLAFWEYKENKGRFFVSTLRCLGILFVLGALSYMLFPIMGPKYLYLTLNQSTYDLYQNLNNNLNNSMYPRNGIPSLHFGLSLFLLLNSYGLSKIKRSLFIIFFILTALATLVLKEHYIIDWIGAIPFVIITILLADNHLKNETKRNLYIINIINLLAFYLFLWFGVSLFEKTFSCMNCDSFNFMMTGSIYFITIGSLINLVYSYKKIYNKENSNILIENVSIKEELSNIKNNMRSLLNTDKKQLSLLFILSGFAGLMYQVVFGKMLGTIFGSTSIAICIILSTYMVGLSIGAWLGSKNETKIPPMIKYALCEGLIALYCVLTPLIFNIISEVYFSLAKLNLENIIYMNILKISLGIIGLIIPTVLMGMTTPILLKEFKDDGNGLSIAKLYTLNTLGAAIGALLSGYVIIQLLGVKSTIYLTVLLNLLICGFVINKFKKENSDELLNQYVKQFFQEFFIMFRKSENKINKNYNFYLSTFILFISGILTMIMETVYTHSLSVVIGNSTYVFSTMLFTFLLGLTLGGNIGKKIIKNLNQDFKVLSVLELMLAISITVSYFLIDLVPNYFASFASSNVINSFESRELLRFGVCFFIMILPTIMTGIIYTVSMNVLSLSQKEENNVIGYGLSINTIGNILGVFLGSFYFINELQINGSFKALTLSALIMSLLITLKSFKDNKKILTTQLILILITIFNPYKMNMNEVTSGNNVYFVNSSRGDVVEYRDNSDGGLTSVNRTIINNKEMLTLLTNGKFQGNDNEESIAQGGFAIAPILHLKNQDNALVIGYGTGMTTKAIYDAKFNQIDVIDLSPDILDLADKYFRKINGNVRQNKNVKTYITDGRNYLHLTDKKYDLISMEISSIWFSGASYLYNKEFYESAKTKLSKNGVLQQWVQLHHMNPQDFLIILNTVRNQFKYVSFYYIGHQGIIVATNSIENKDDLEENIEKLNNNKDLNTLKSYYENDFKNIANFKILNSEQIDKMLLSKFKNNINYAISTDDNLYLEYKTPKGNVLKVDTEKMIIDFLLGYKK